jgi:LuxR family maltose regulon positive regulatory protein
MAGEKPSPKVPPVLLLETRFFAPPLPPARISRPRLLKQLESGLQLPVTLISASAGFGKSLLASEWLASNADLRAVWLSLEKADNEWTRFFHYLVAAWQHIYPHVGETSLAELNDSLAFNAQNLVDALISDLLSSQETDQAHPTVLVLDDYQHIENPAIHQTITYLVEHLPPHSHIILITRTDPPLPTSRWRLRRMMLELRVEDLRFTLAEADEFLNQTMRLDLPLEQLEILETRTEGWIAGLQLAALSLHGRQDSADFIRAFGGSHRYVLDYLVEEVINQQPEEIRQFLLTSAVLDQFCAPLCDALLDTSAPYSQTMLERLEKGNLFVTPLDDQRYWYRYHHLFSELLRVHLRRSAPERISMLYRQAANWLMHNSLWREAIYYALEAGDDNLGASLFEQAIQFGGFNFLDSGMQSLVILFLDHFFQDRPLLELAKAIAMVETSQVTGIEEILRSLEQRIQALPPFGRQSEILGTVYVYQGIAASLIGDSTWILEASQQVTRLLPHHVQANIRALIQIGNVYFYDGNLHLNQSYWQQALELSIANSHIFGILCCLDNLGRSCCHMGVLISAETFFKRALELLSEKASPRWLSGTQRDYSDLLREMNRLTEAHTMMATSLQLAEQWETSSGLGLGYIHMGRILLANGDVQAARSFLDKADALAKTHTIYPDLQVIIEVFRARLFMENDNLDAAWHVLESCLVSSCCRHKFHREWIFISQARVYLRKGLPAEALDLLKDYMQDAMVYGRGWNWLEMCLLSAQAKHAIGKSGEALELLQSGLVYAQMHGFVRIFVDEGLPMHILLERFLETCPSGSLRNYVNGLLGAFPSQAIPLATLALIEPLSERELQVLKLVCDGLSNQEIAARLVLSVGTVKTHIHNIFGKLGVINRPQAIARARQLLGQVS